MLQEAPDELLVSGRAKADRVGHTLIVLSDAVVGHPRRKIEHVPRAENKGLIRLEVGEDAHVEVRHDLFVLHRLRADFPTPVPLPL
jgi:hypothetical protein